MAASRKLYRMLADDLGEAKFKAQVNGENADVINVLALDIAASLGADNPRFDRARFLGAVDQRVEDLEKREMGV